MIACPFLLATSAYGFWKWNRIINVPYVLGGWELAYLTNIVVLPLLLIVLLLFLIMQEREHRKLCASYQSRIDHLQYRLNTQEDFLHMMSDLTPEPVTIFDHQDKVWFINLAAAKKLGVEAADIIGKPFNKAANPAQIEKLQMRLHQVRTSRKPIDALEQAEDNHGQVHFIQTHYHYMPPFTGFDGGVMLREGNVTNLIVERERRESMLRQLIDTLIAVVDRRDPYASGHSAHVGQLSRVIAEEMVLGEKEIEACEIAGSLMNFGKVLVPRDILTKAGALTPDELRSVRESLLTSCEILSIINFHVPVVPTLRQILERPDGAGLPNHLKNDEIIVTARVVAVANAFVALVSPRAHRPSLEYSAALQHLLQNSDTAFDRRVVTALINYIANRPKKLDWLSHTKQI